MTPLTILLPLLGVLLTQSAGATISPLNIQSDITKSRSNSFILEKTSSSTKSLNYKDILASSNRKKNTPIQQSKFQEARTSILTIVLPWLYFLSISVNMPSFPKYVNWCVNKGDSTVSPLSQKIYGDYSGLDSFFTFLAVNFIGCLSDSYGRKPFLMLSAGGLGLSYLVSLFAVRSHYLFYMSGCIDGLTSSMFAQAQAYATDWSRRQETIISKEKNRSNIGKIESVNLSDVIGRFQGLAIGCAFIIGIPLNVILTTRGSYRNPIILAVMLCAISCIGTYLFLPESLQFKKDATGKMIRKPIMWRDANPLGAMKLFLSRGSRLGLGALAYFFINLSHTGMSVVWVNYLGKRFGWSSHQAGAAFMLLGVMIIFAPKILTNLFGRSLSVAAAILIHAIALAVLGACSNGIMIAALGIPLLAIGVAAMPLTLGYLSEQVGEDEVGALQGSADTVRSLASMAGGPLMSRAFAYFSSLSSTHLHGGSLLLCSGCSLTAFLLYSYMLSTTSSDDRKVITPKKSV